VREVRREAWIWLDRHNGRYECTDCENKSDVQNDASDHSVSLSDPPLYSALRLFSNIPGHLRIPDINDFNLI